MINKVTLIGNLGQDPELKYTANQIPVCQLSIATKETWMKDGNKQETTEWHRVNVWNKQAESCSKFLHKGSQVYVEGKIKTRMYEKNGEKRYATEIEAKGIKFMSSPKNEPRPLPPKPAQSPEQTTGVFSPNIDDIPF
jgi:single-strand DNA-binding protein